MTEQKTRFTVTFDLADHDGFVHNTEGPHTIVLRLPEPLDGRALNGGATVDVDLVLVLNQRDEVPLRVRAPVYTGRDQSLIPVVRHLARIYKSVALASAPEKKTVTFSDGRSAVVRTEPSDDPRMRTRAVEIEGKTTIVTDGQPHARAAPVNHCEIRVAGETVAWRSTY